MGPLVRWSPPALHRVDRNLVAHGVVDGWLRILSKNVKSNQFLRYLELTSQSTEVIWAEPKFQIQESVADVDFGALDVHHYYSVGILKARSTYTYLQVYFVVARCWA